MHEDNKILSGNLAFGVYSVKYRGKHQRVVFNQNITCIYWGSGYMSKWDIFFNIIFVLAWLMLFTLIGIFIYGYIEGRLII